MKKFVATAVVLGALVCAAPAKACDPTVAQLAAALTAQGYGNASVLSHAVVIQNGARVRRVVFRDRVGAVHVRFVRF